jgi:TolB-like protein
MEGELLNRLTAPPGAVFLSYASQDTDAAQRICEALRAAGIEVWFDQCELRGGDAWDQKIRREIHDCALFVPIISANTASRQEGYFRLEWDLADQRTHMMARDRAFIVPVCLDATPGAGTDVPESFQRVQWMRLPSGETPPEFVVRIKRLLSPERPATARLPAGAASGSSPIPLTTGPPSPLRRALLVTIAVLVAAALAYLLIDKLWISKPAAPPATSNATSSPGAPPAAFTPPPHSIAVLPFVNMSGDKEQEYFSDGLSEELLNSLSRINELQVAARTSSFYFKGEHADLGTIARRLNVASILEGSVRRSGQKIRITAQLNNAVTGFHLWSETYDRDLGDVLKVQTEIADAVAGALKIKLLGGAAEKVELGGTRIPAAFDAYLRGLKLARVANSEEQCDAPISAFSEAIAADANYALAYASRSLIRWDCATYYTSDWLQQAVGSGVRSDAAHAIELAPGLAAGYIAMSNLESGLLRFAPANEACTRALALAPNNDQAIYYCSQLAALFGRTEEAVALAHRGVALDPFNPRSYRALGDVLRFARRHGDAIAAYQQSIGVDPEHADYAYAARGVSYYLAGNLPAALASCDVRPDYVRSLVCKAMIYGKLGRQRDASAALAALVQRAGDGAAYQYAQIHTQWNDHRAALDWLDKAKRLGDPGLINLRTDPLLDPLRKELRFQAIERELKFPS